LSAQKTLPNHRQFPNKKTPKTRPQTEQFATEEITTEDFLPQIDFPLRCAS
jgi:hypothetical protein